MAGASFPGIKSARRWHEPCYFVERPSIQRAMSFLSPLSPRMVVALMVGVTVVSLVTARRDVSVRVAEIRRVEVERAGREAARIAPDAARAIEARDTSALRTLLERSVGRGAAVGAIV